jgi:hypothetical protein
VPSISLEKRVRRENSKNVCATGKQPIERIDRWSMLWEMRQCFLANNRISFLHIQHCCPSPISIVVVTIIQQTRYLVLNYDSTDLAVQERLNSLCDISKSGCEMFSLLVHRLADNQIPILCNRG